MSVTSFASSGSVKNQRVLIIHSFRYGLSANAQMDSTVVTNRAIQTTMETEGAFNIAFHSERMDVSALPEKRYFQDRRDAYQKKYADQQMDLIIAVNYRALKFLLIHGEEIWPKVPILFAGVEEGRREQLKTLRPNITGLYVNARFGDMLGTIFEIQPETNHITVIVGSSSTERSIEDRVRRLYGKYADRADFTYLSDISFDAVLSKVANQPLNSAVMFLTLIKDGQGNPVPENALQLISRVSRAPVYGLFDVYVGHGIVGGTLYSVEHRGDLIGKMGLRILAGEKPEDIAIGTGQRHFDLYDWRQLKRWGISERSLPPGSIVRFKELSAWDRYKGRIVGVFILIAAMLAIILYLLHLRRIRGQVEQMLESSRDDLENTVKTLKEREQRLREVSAARASLQDEVKHLDRVVTMGTLTASIAHEINQPLGAILSNAQAAIRFLKAKQPDIVQVREALEDIVSDDKRAAVVIRRLRMMLKKEELKRNKLQIDSVLKEIVDLLQSELILNNVSIRIDLEKELPVIWGDRIQIQQVVLNLLVNALEAVKDLPEEKREIRLSARSELPDKILISVSDLGPGIEAHKRESIFEAFYTTKKRGLGMGLPICKTIIEQHYGEIWTSDIPEGGAVFCFTLPIGNDDDHGDS